MWWKRDVGLDRGGVVVRCGSGGAGCRARGPWVVHGWDRVVIDGRECKLNVDVWWELAFGLNGGSRGRFGSNRKTK